MKFDMELEDILYTMKKKDGEVPEDDKSAEAAAQEQQVTPAVEPPKPEAAPEADTPAASDTQAAESADSEPEELVWLDGNKPPKEKTHAPRQSLKEKYNNSLQPKLKALCGKLMKKQTLLIIGAVLLAALLAFGGVKIAQLSKAATLKKYSEQYGVEYPEDIRKEFYEAFGENPSLAGNIVIPDTDTDVAVYSEPEDGEGLFEKGSSVYESQHYRAIALSKEQADLERIYATGEGYTDASQSMTFRTLFGDETYHIIAAYYTNTLPEDDNGYLFPYNCYGNFTEDSQFQYQDRIKTRSLYVTGLLIQPEDECLTVSVDSDIMPSYRFVVVGVKVKNHVKKIKTVETNEEVHYPQSYCDKLGIHNRYWLAGHWYPEIYTDAEQTETQQLTLDDFYTEK